MSDKTGIEWTEATWNPTTGCTKVSAGCKNCYAKHQAWPRLAATPGCVYYGREFEDVQCHPERLDQPIRWTRPRMIFVNSMSDLFHPDVPFEFIGQVFAVMSVTTRHTFQILTKRPERMREFFQWADEEYSGWWDAPFPKHIPWRPARGGSGGYDNCGPAFPFENIWLGVSVEDQATADERIPLLLDTPAAVRWISAEPLLGVVDLRLVRALPLSAGEGPGATCRSADRLGLSWVVVGGESGKNARPMHPDWARSLRDQCQAAGVPFLFKQWGEWAPVDPNAALRSRTTMPGQNGDLWAFADGTKDGWRSGPISKLIGKKRAGRDLDGRSWDEYPEKRA